MAGRIYCLLFHEKKIAARVTAIKYREKKSSNEHISASVIRKNQTGVINVSTEQPITFSDDQDNECSFIEPTTLRVLGSGNVQFSLWRANNIRWQNLTIDKSARALQKQQVPCCIWFTGLSGSGKSTIANLLEKRLHEKNLHTYLLDGDNLRHGLNRDLGFTEADRVENIRRVAEVARLMVDAGLIVIASFISPYRSDRQMARNLFADGEFVEVFIDTPLHECEKRDVKGLYAKARRGELKNFTGIDSAYEAPETAELTLSTINTSADMCAEQVLRFLQLP
jgi:adenylyl-sulfate kinase